MICAGVWVKIRTRQSRRMAGHIQKRMLRHTLKHMFASTWFYLLLALSRTPKMQIHRASGPKEMSSAASSRESPAWAKRKEGTRIIAALMLPPSAAKNVRSCDRSRRVVWMIKAKNNCERGAGNGRIHASYSFGVGAHPIVRANSLFAAFSKKKNVYAVGDIQPSQVGKWLNAPVRPGGQRVSLYA